MATSLLTLLDDITSVLDDVATMTKVAARKSAAVLGDDLALNAQQLIGVQARRELPVVWAVAKGSMVNKAILVPAALAISAVTPWAVTPLLMIGGAYLCFEGVEKLGHKFLPSAERHGQGAHGATHAAGGSGRTASRQVVTDDGTRADACQAVVKPADEEHRRIRGAIRTDFVLSAEIVVITLGTIANQPIGQRFAVQVAIAVLMTAGVYGFVAGIVKLDDLGLALAARSSAATRSAGQMILASAPWLLRGLSIAGTAAMFLVGCGILTHGVESLHHLSEHLAEALPGPTLWAFTKAFDALVGMVLGTLVLTAAAFAKRVRR